MTALQAQSGLGLLALCLLAWGLGETKCEPGGLLPCRLGNTHMRWLGIGVAIGDRSLPLQDLVGSRFSISLEILACSSSDDRRPSDHVVV